MILMRLLNKELWKEKYFLLVLYSLSNFSLHQVLIFILFSFGAKKILEAEV